MTARTTPYKIRPAARFGPYVVLLEDDLIAFARSLANDQWHRAQQEWREKAGPAIVRSLVADLGSQGLLISEAQRDQLLLRAAEDNVRARLQQAPDVVQKIEIVGMPPMAAEVVRGPDGKVAGIVDAGR